MYNFDILYRPGRHNQDVDFLSRPPSSVFLAISSPVPEIITKLKKYYHTATGQQEKNKRIGIPNLDFNFHKDLLYHGQRLYIPSTTNLRPSILHEFHATPSAGHSGLKATPARLTASFYWPGMYMDTKTFIRECLPCQQNKPINTKPLGLL